MNSPFIHQKVFYVELEYPEKSSVLLEIFAPTRLHVFGQLINNYDSELYSAVTVNIEESQADLTEYGDYFPVNKDPEPVTRLDKFKQFIKNKISSFLSDFNYYMDSTLNMVTLFCIILTAGLLSDALLLQPIFDSIQAAYLTGLSDVKP